MSRETAAGNFFEDFHVGQQIRHASPRTVHGGDLSLYIGLTGDRRPLSSSTEYAQSLGFGRELAHDLLTFHLVFGKSVQDISLNAVANLGYADVRFLEPVYPGDTLSAESQVVGLRETSSGKAGVVYVQTTGRNQRQREVLRYYRWVLVNKRDPSVKLGVSDVPHLPEEVKASELTIPSVLQLSRFDDLRWATGGSSYFEDYQPGQVVHHQDGMTLEEADHMLLTRLVQNTAKVHFNAHAMASSRFGKRLIYGGHIISVAHAIAFEGFENVLTMAAWNGGQHVNPCFAGDTIYARTEVLDRAELGGPSERLGALRMRLLAFKNCPSRDVGQVKDSDGTYSEHVVLDLDYWGLVPRRNRS